jgi:hypothetical protein
MEFRAFFSYGEWFGTEPREFLFRGTAEVPSEQTICFVYSVFRGIIMLSEISNRTSLPHPPFLSRSSLNIFTSFSPFLSLSFSLNFSHSGQCWIFGFGLTLILERCGCRTDAVDKRWENAGVGLIFTRHCGIPTFTYL